MKSKLTFAEAEQIRAEVSLLKMTKTLLTKVEQTTRNGHLIGSHYRKSGASAMVAKRRGLPKHVVADIVRYKTFVPDCIAE